MDNRGTLISRDLPFYTFQTCVLLSSPVSLSQSRPLSFFRTAITSSLPHRAPCFRPYLPPTRSSHLRSSVMVRFCSENSGCRNSLRPAGGDVAFRRGRTATKASRDPAVSAPEGGVAEIAVRAPRHDVIRRGWLAAILLLVLACSLLGKQRKCFGGLSICSGGSPSPVILRAPPPPASCSPSSDQASAETLEVRTHTQLDTLADWF